MFKLSVHLPIDAESPESIENQQKTNIQIMNHLRKNGFEIFCRNTVLNTISRIPRGNEHIIILNHDPIWAIGEFDELPIDILQIISKYGWVYYTLQKTSESPSH